MHRGAIVIINQLGFNRSSIVIIKINCSAIVNIKTIFFFQHVSAFYTVYSLKMLKKEKCFDKSKDFFEL